MKSPAKKSPSIKLKNEDGTTYDVPEKGSLGLLALGAVGLAAWRRKRKVVPVPIPRKKSPEKKKK
ncbi:MAG: PEP-CTERM sorting domain-containing protein [Bacteroidetes bacterium]|nr:PEP-CTERM sorting domain-containing protein [Bacteroidota bacterium]